jgi:hypothetical protein
MSGTGNVVALLAVSLFTLGESGRDGTAARSEASRTAVTGEAGRSASPCRAPMPRTALEVPAGNALEMELYAMGVQIYTCTASATGAAWAFSAPEATLFRHGELAGRHYAGPTWESKDGSTVVGAKVTSATPDPTAIPWLLLQAASHGGHGRMDEVTFLQRVDTRGGLTPTGGCDGSTLGAVASVAYTATYCFYEAKGD